MISDGDEVIIKDQNEASSQQVAKVEPDNEESGEKEQPAEEN